MSIPAEYEAAWKEIVAKSWADDKFKKNLVANPNKVLSDAGMSLPAGVNFVVVENEPSRIHLVLPAQPSGDVSVEARGATGSDYDPGF